ncbi:MAG TPA: hypothetical protein VH520_03750 [Streptosporangiaceae bacterium]
MSVAECQYPQSHATKRPLGEEIAAIAASRPLAASFYLDTKEEHSRPWPFEGKDHHQGLARTHRLQDGTVYFFLTHSEVGPGEQGQLMQFRYDGPLQGEHIAASDPLHVAAMAEQIYLAEPHPCDIQFLPDVNSADAGYLFVVEAFLAQWISVWAWAPETNLRQLGAIDQGFPQNQRPSFVFVDRDGDTVFLGVGWDNGEGRGFRAAARKLFPTCRVGEIDLLAFEPIEPDGFFAMPDMNGASQVKLVRDTTGSWSLLGFRSHADDDPHGDDFIDVYDIDLPAFAISAQPQSTHVFLPGGDTGFASTGTCHVEESGRLLVSSSYRWSKDELPHGAEYVSRVDELPSL